MLEGALLMMGWILPLPSLRKTAHKAKNNLPTNEAGSPNHNRPRFRVFTSVSTKVLIRFAVIKIVGFAFGNGLAFWRKTPGICQRPRLPKPAWAP